MEAENIADDSFFSSVKMQCSFVGVLNLFHSLPLLACYIFVCGELHGTGILSVFTTVLHLFKKGVIK